MLTTRERALRAVGVMFLAAGCLMLLCLAGCQWLDAGGASWTDIGLGVVAVAFGAAVLWRWWRTPRNEGD